VTAARVPKLMKKKNLLKKYAIWDFSFSSFSSNWSDPNPETLDFRPPVPSAIRYSDKYKIPIWNPFACWQLSLLAWQGGGRSCGNFDEIANAAVP